MSPERWQRMWGIFEKAVELPPEGRLDYIASVCGEDQVLRRITAELVAADAEAESDLAPFAAETRHDTGGVASATAKPHGPELETIGAYRLLRRIGEGGMGTVYLAMRDDGFRRQVVVKLLKQGMASEDMARRLRTERQILANLNHPYVARLYDGGATEDQLPYFVMEYVEGVEIDTYCDRNRLSVDARLTLFRKVCEAVEYAHRNLVVHRDLKPSNILVTAEADPKLLDFGLAKLLDPDLMTAAYEPTAAWQRLLTPSYASPEQVRGERITTASDVYSLGVLLYKLLTGQLPRRLTGRSLREIEHILTEGEPPLPSAVVVRAPTDGAPGSCEPAAEIGRARGVRPNELARQLAGDLDAIVLKALRAAPRERYGSVERFAADVERYQHGLPVAARRGSWRYRAAKFLRRHRLAAAVSAAILSLLVTFAAAMAWQSQRVARERDEARRERDAKDSVLALMLDTFRVVDPAAGDGVGKELTVREALERNGPLLDQRLREQPEVRAEILQATGMIFRNLGLFDRAHEQLEQALEVRRELFGDDHLEVAEILVALGDVQLLQGEQEKARETSNEAVEMTRRLVDADDPALVAPLNGLVAVLCDMEAYEAAMPLAGEALELARGTPDQDIRRLNALVNMAAVTKGRGDLVAAAELYHQVLALDRAILGERHPLLADDLNNLGVTLRRLERLEEAEETLRRALALQRQVLGAAHPSLVLTLNNLGGALEAQGKDTEALEHFSAALKVLLEAEGPDHPRAFFLELRIEAVRLRLGEPEAAERSLRSGLDRWRGSLGEEHPWIARAEGLLGEALLRQSRYPEAEPWLLRSLGTFQRRGEDRDAREASQRLVLLYQEWDRPEKAAEYRAAALEEEQP